MLPVVPCVHKIFKNKRTFIMANLPQIQAPQPVAIEEMVVPAQSYPDLYLTSLHLTTTDVQNLSATVYAYLTPYNYTAKQIMPDALEQEFAIQDIWAEAERNPAFATVMGSLIQTIALMVKERHLVEQIASGVTGLEEQLSQIRAELGVV
jgi:hypothetical protein